MKAYLTRLGVILEARDGERFAVDLEWDALFTATEPFDLVSNALAAGRPVSDVDELTAPIGRQEVWAAGVTYFRSRSARMAEAESAGGGGFYDRVYTAVRPELFFKGSRSRISGHGEVVRVRGDSDWSVPEPELALAVSSSGRIIGFTIGNDVSARDIEGENPLYLPQAKVYARSCAVGPALLLGPDPLPRETEIRMDVVRDGGVVFAGSTALSSMKRTPEELVDFLFRDNVFPDGCYLLTGTGIVPPDEFTLRSGDEISITIEPIGTLVNRVE